MILIYKKEFQKKHPNIKVHSTIDSIFKYCLDNLMIIKKPISIWLIFATGLTFGCAQLHHVQIGEIYNLDNYTYTPFEVMVSETGVNLKEATRIARPFLNSSENQRVKDIEQIISLFQFGPVTGNPVYVKDYAKNLALTIYDRCPSGRITGVMSIRETRKYPVISGEIVKVTGYCVQNKGI